MSKIKSKIRRGLGGKTDNRPSRMSATGLVVIFWALFIDIMAITLLFVTLFTLGLTSPLQSIPSFIGMITLGTFHWFVVDKRRPISRKLWNLAKKFILGWLPFYWTALTIIRLTK